MPPRYFKDRFYFLLVAILFLGKKQVFFFHFLKQNSWWRLSLHQESTKALGGEWAYTKSPPRLLVEIEPTPRVHQGSWWRMGLHQESYTKSPPRLLVENGPTPRVHQELSWVSWWIMGLHQESTKALGGEWAYTKSPPRLLVDSWWTF